ncbi:MAG TPA: SEC-C metal-binding domain-containing protein, partial [Bryobacteraceae bacterium]|nr:SEC-C metal-binding domain-containing protein [Bryobacteraceae bacterium]
ERGQPVLVGTISVEKSEKLSGILRRMGVKHEVLNAKNHEREAYIVAQAGRKGAVTVSTNMAGRGTDILLGGNPEYQTKEYFRKQNRDPDTVPREEWDAVFQRYKEETDLEHEEVVALGGLHIVGTERHESRRIDNQLRGRAGRQGDPGSSRFYLSLQDDLLRIFGGERIQNLMLRLGMEEDVPIESRLITKRIEAAQKAVEAQNFAARKHLLEYDDVMNKQREFIYRWRRQLLEKQDQREWVFETSRSILQFFIDSRMPEKSHPSTWDLAGLQTDVNSQFGVKINTAELASMNRQEIEDAIFEQIENKYREKEELIGPEAMRETERLIMLHVIDTQWKDHLLSMDHLKEGIGLRGYGQKDPLVEYKKESFMLFEALRDRIEDEVIRYLFFLRPAEADRLPLPLADQEPSEDTEAEQELVAAAAQRAAAQATIEDFTRNIQRKKDKEMAELQFVGGERSATTAKTVVKTTKVGRNEPCPCGSGKKYKKCCGVNA